jgi:hypothetical protein
VLGSNVVLVATTDTLILTTASLATGVWLVTMQAELFGGAIYTAAIELLAGTATVSSFGGVQTAEGSEAAGQEFDISLTCIVTITGAGTLLMHAKSTSTPTVYALGHSEYTTLPVTGYTAVKIG